MWINQLQIPNGLCNYLINSCYVFQSFAMLSEKLEPLVEGVRRNKEHWLEKAMTNHVDENEEDMADSGYVWDLNQVRGADWIQVRRWGKQGYLFVQPEEKTLCWHSAGNHKKSLLSVKRLVRTPETKSYTTVIIITWPEMHRFVFFSIFILDDYTSKRELFFFYFFLGFCMLDEKNII